MGQGVLYDMRFESRDFDLYGMSYSLYTGDYQN